MVSLDPAGGVSRPGSRRLSTRVAATTRSEPDRLRALGDAAAPTRIDCRCLAGARVHVHPGGHFVPADPEAIQTYRDFLVGSAARSPPNLPAATDEPQAIIEGVLAALGHKGDKSVDRALRHIWDHLAGDNFKFVYRDSDVEEFIADARTTAEEFSTSFYGNAINGKRWQIIRDFQTTGADGWIGTAVVETISSDDRLRRWIWELRKHKRPPKMGSWFIENIGSSDADGTFDSD